MIHDDWRDRLARAPDFASYLRESPSEDLERIIYDDPHKARVFGKWPTQRIKHTKVLVEEISHRARVEALQEAANLLRRLHNDSQSDRLHPDQIEVALLSLADRTPQPLSKAG